MTAVGAAPLHIALPNSFRQPRRRLLSALSSRCLIAAVFFAALLAAALAGCDDTAAPDPGIVFAAWADGGPGVSSGKIDFEFGAPVGTLKVTDILIDPASDADLIKVTLGALTKDAADPKRWTLSVEVQDGGTAVVFIKKNGIRGMQAINLYDGSKSPEQRDVYVAWASGSGSGAKINFTFSANVSSLQEEDIEFQVLSGAATRGAIEGSGAEWSLGVDVTAEGEAEVAIAKEGIKKTAQVVPLRRYSSGGITYTAAANGGPGVPSDKIDFEFSADISGLSPDDILISETSGAVKKGLLTGSGKTWSLAIEVTGECVAGVSITKAGVDGGMLGVRLYANAVAAPTASLPSGTVAIDTDL